MKDLTLLKNPHGLLYKVFSMYARRFLALRQEARQGCFYNIEKTVVAVNK
jgi:hypothetical protein